MKPNRSFDLFLTWLAPAGFLIAALLRLLYITSNDVAMDEPFTIFFAQADLRVIFNMLPQENNPPLFFLLMHFWIKIFGISPLSIRILPCLFGILTVAVLFRIGKSFYSKEAGLLAAALFTLSDYHQLFAHEARVYSLFALLTAVSMYCFLALATQPESRKFLSLLTIVNILLIYAHFFGFFIFLIQGLSVLVIREYRKRLLKIYLFSIVASLIAYLPYFPIFFNRFFLSAGNGTWVEPPVVSDLYTMVWRYLNAPVVTVVVLGILLSALIKWGLMINRGKAPVNARSMVLLVWFSVPYLLMFVVSFKIPLFLDRYTVFISVGFYLLAAVAVDYLVTGLRIKLMAMSVLIIMMAVTFHPDSDNKRNLREAVTFISGRMGSGTSVIICPPWLEYGFAYHFRKNIFTDVEHFRSGLNNEGIYPLNNFLEADTAMLKKSKQVLLFEEGMTLSDPDETISNWLKKEFNYVQTFTFRENFHLHQYVK